MSEARAPSSRLVFAGGLAALLVGLVVVVTVANEGGDEPRGEPADTACVQEWNDDVAAVSLGQHQAGSHGYSDVQVVRLTPSGLRSTARRVGAPSRVSLAEVRSG